MPYVFLVVGLALAITSIEGTYNALGKELKQDFSGKGGFQWWALAIVLVGALGYIQSVRPLANKMLALILVVLVLANKGAWANLVQTFEQGAIAPAKNTNPAPSAKTATQSANDAFLGNNKGFGLWDTITQSIPQSDKTKSANDAFLSNNKGFDLGKIALGIFGF